MKETHNTTDHLLSAGNYQVFVSCISGAAGLTTIIMSDKSIRQDKG